MQKNGPILSAGGVTLNLSETPKKNKNPELKGVQKTPPPPPSPPSLLSLSNLNPIQKRLLKTLKVDQLSTDITPRNRGKLTADLNAPKAISGAEVRQGKRGRLLDKDSTPLPADNELHENKNEINRILKIFNNSLEEIKEFTLKHSILVTPNAKIEDYAAAIINQKQGLDKDEEESEEDDEEEDDEDEDNEEDNEEKSNPLKVEKEKGKENCEEKKITTHIVTFDSKNLTREPPEVRDLFEFLSHLESKNLIKKANEMSLNPNSVEVDKNLILCMAQRLAKVTSTQWLELAGKDEKLSSLIKPNCSHEEILNIATQLIYQLHLSFKSISQWIQKSKTIMPWSLVKELTALNQSKTQEVKNDLLPVLLKNIKNLAFISQNIQDPKQLDVRLVQVIKELEDFGNFDSASADSDFREELKRLELLLFKIKLMKNPNLVSNLAKLMQIKMVSMSEDDLVDRLISAMDEAKEFVQIKTFDGIPSRLVEWIEKIINNFGDLREIPHFFRNLIITMSSKREIKSDDYSSCVNKWAFDLIRKNSSDVWELAGLYKFAVPYDLLNKEKIYQIILTKDLNNFRMTYYHIPSPRKKVEIKSEFQKKLGITFDDSKTPIKKYKVAIDKAPPVTIISLADKVQKQRIDGMLTYFSETEILELAQKLAIKNLNEGSSPLPKAIINKLIVGIIQDIQECIADHAQDESLFKELLKNAIKLHICKDKDFLYSVELAQNNSYYVLLLVVAYISLLRDKEDLQEEFDFNFTYLMDHAADLAEFADLLELSFNLSSIDQINRAGLACRILFKLNANNSFEEENIQELKETGCDDGFEELTIVLILNQLKKAAEALEEDDDDDDEEQKDDEEKGKVKKEDENEDEEEDIIQKLLQRTPSNLKKAASLKENKQEIKLENRGLGTKPKMLPRRLFMVTTSSENSNIKKIMADYIKELFDIMKNYNDSVDTGLKSLVRKKKTTNRFMAISKCQQNIREVFLADMKIELKLIPILRSTEEIFVVFDHSVSNSTNGSINPHRKKLADFFSCYLLKLINESQVTPEIKSFLINNFSIINILWQDARLCYQFRDGGKVQALRRDLIVLASRHTATTSNTMALIQTARKIWLETAQLFAQMHAKIVQASPKNLETAKQMLVKMSEEIEIYDRDFKQGTASERPKWVQCFTQCLQYFIPCSLLPGFIKQMLMKDMNSILKLLDPQFSTRNISVSKTLRDELIQLIFNTVPFENIRVCASVGEIDFKTILFKIAKIETTTTSDHGRLLTPRTPRSSPDKVGLSPLGTPRSSPSHSPSHLLNGTNGKSSSPRSAS